MGIEVLNEFYKNDKFLIAPPVAHIWHMFMDVVTLLP
jgi:hypothetical protein